MRSYAILYASIAVILSLGNLPRLINGGPVKYHDDLQSAAAENYNGNDTEWIIDDMNQPGAASPVISIRKMLPMNNFFRFYCGPGQRRDANGRCRVIFSI